MLSEEARAELAAIAPLRRCDRLAELSGLFHTAGRLHLHGRGELSLDLDVASAAVARRAFRLLRELGLASEVWTYEEHAFARPVRYQLRVEGAGDALAVLREAGVLGPGGRPLQRPPKRVAGRGCCRAAYLRGAFLGGGSVTPPPSGHLEVRTPTLDGAEFLSWVGACEGIDLRARVRARYSIAYAKGAETIADALAFAGASEAALALDEHAVVAAARSQANRLANADHANLVRLSRAAHRQLRALARLERDGRLGELPGPLREMAELRLRNPSLSVRELASKCRPPATKATAYRRLQRLARLAED